MDPFEILGIDYQCNIDNLDSIYYKLFKESSTVKRMEINEAYSILKNPLKRLKFLCQRYGYSKNHNILSKIFKIKKMSSSKQEIIKVSLYKNFEKQIEKNKLNKIHTIIQLLEYLN